MNKDFQSIEDLLKNNSSENNTQGIFVKKQSEIKEKDTERLTKSRADNLGIPYISLKGSPISAEALSVLNIEDCKENKMVCFYYDGHYLRLGALNPLSEKVKEIAAELNESLHTDGMLYLISEYSFDYALDAYAKLPKIKQAPAGVTITEEDLNKYGEEFTTFENLDQQLKGAPLSDIIVILMAAAIKSGSSDIHIECEEKDIKVRFRIDGMLHDVAAINSELWEKIISRLKVLSKVKINVNDKPQDGRISIFTQKEQIDIRASFLPTSYGESVVMRILRGSSVGLAFEKLGIRDQSFRQLEKEVNRPNGMIITTGPTGSGKTTTLYAILKKLNTKETKIITIEDPIEYQLEGINQSQVGANFTFAKALRSIVRQDPDIIMVGEIRDLETAETAIQAALTGHLVLSTIHTNDAAGAIPRFLSMGVKPFLLAPSINAVVGQRLVRKLCEFCKQPEELDPEKLARVKEILDKIPTEHKNGIELNNIKFYKEKGCDKCQGIGYKGRIGIYEIMVMNKEIEKLILSGNVSEYDMADAAIKNGMITMVQDGILKAAEGITSVDEVFRVAE